jgi:hypothetical protein
MIAALLSGKGAAPAQSPAASVTTVGTVPAAVVAAPTSPAVDTSHKIYSNDEPSPMDPPSGQDRINMVATALGEEKPGSPESLGVINTIRNRAVDGGYGGDTPTAVVTAPSQYSPWNDAAGRAGMSRSMQNPDAVAKVNDAIDQAYGVGKYVAAGPNDNTDGKTHFYDPGSMVPANSMPRWAQGKEYQTIGNTRFLDDPDDAPGAKPVQVASIPAAATPTQGYAVPGQPAAVAPVAVAPAAPPVAAVAPAAVAKVSGALGNVNPAVMQALTSPYSSDATKKVAGAILTQQLANANKDSYSQETDKDGNIWSVNMKTGQRTVAKAADKDPASVQEFEYGQTHPDFVAQQLAKTKAGAAQLNNQNNIDMNSGQTYDKQLAEGLGKSHAALANGVEDAQARARDIAAMQGAVDAIQKNGGTTGGLAPAQRLELQKSVNAGAAALGIDKPFDESDLSDKEFLTKFNRSMAGAQAKNAVGSRVTNFEMSNFLKANPGLDMTITGNQRLLGIQGQIEQRNIAVGNAIRDATAQAISNGKKIDPVTVQKIITDYDQGHHVQDPTTGQDLTQSYALPEFQTQGNNAALAVGHETNIGNIKIKRVN